MQIIFLPKKYGDQPVTHNIVEGSTITKNYNETLDSAEIRISHLTEPLNIEPFDKVVLRDENNRLGGDMYMCVDTYTETMESLDPVIYTYQISLFSETKELEGILLPNLSITQLPDGTNRKVKEYLDRYLELYGTKLRTSTDFIPKYTFGHNIYDETDTVASRFNNVICPEMQWNCPTLREVITDLMMVNDCIPVVRNNVIHFMDLTQKRNAVDTSKVNYIQRSQSSEDYVSELKMDMLNVMQTSLDGVKQTVNRMEYQTFKADGDGYVVTSDNVVVKTEYPILNIKHLWIVFQSNIQTGSADNYETTMYKNDLCDLLLIDGSHVNLVFEKQEYATLPQRRYNPTDFSEINQNISVYFNREGNTVEGWYNLSRKNWTFNLKISALEIIKSLIVDYCYDVNGVHAVYPRGSGGDNTYYSTFFIIEYETTADAVFKAGKDIAPTHSREVTDNQTNAYVDAYNQGFMEYQKVNRLGNHQLFINARNQGGPLIDIGDYYGDNIVFQTQYQIYVDHIEINASATKNYILRDYFTGVKARIRSWKIADANQSLTRHDLEKIYLEFSKSIKVEQSTFYNNLAKYFLSPLYATEIRPLRYCICYFETNDENYGWYSVDLLGRIIGNSIVFTFGINDNFGIGKSVAEITTNDIDVSRFDNENEHKIFSIKNSFVNKYGGVPLKDVKYVDNNGEFINVEYRFASGVSDGYFPQSLIMDGIGILVGPNSQKQWMLEQCNLPLVSTSSFSSYTKYSKNKLLYKDNREMPKISTQFEFCSDTHNIVFTKKFLQLQECIRELNSEEKVVENRASTITLTPSDYVQLGGTQTVNIPVTPPYVIAGESSFYKEYSHVIPSLYGKYLSSSSISATSGGTNTVNYDSTYDSGGGAITDRGGRFYGRIYSNDRNTAQTATISYVVEGQESVFWVGNSNGSVINDLIGQKAQNIVITSGPTLQEGEELRVTFDSTTGQFHIYYKTFTQLSGNITVSFTYDWVKQDGLYVGNSVKVYRGAKSEFDWKHPEKGFGRAVYYSDITVNVSSGSQYATVTLNNASSGYAYYITDDSDNLLLATNDITTFYLNILLSRDYNIYDSSGNIVSSI